MYLLQCCPTLFGLFRLAPGFIEFDQLFERLDCMGMLRTEFALSTANCVQEVWIHGFVLRLDQVQIP